MELKLSFDQKHFHEWLMTQGLSKKAAGDNVSRCCRVEKDLNVNLSDAVSDEKSYLELFEKIHVYSINKSNSVPACYTLAGTLKYSVRKFALSNMAMPQ